MAPPVSAPFGFAKIVFLSHVLAAGAPMFPAALKATNAWFPDREKAAATSIYISGTQVGLAIAPPIATALMLALGWPAMFVIMGLLGFVALAGWLVLYRQPADSRWASTDELAYIRAGADQGVPARGGVGGVHEVDRVGHPAGAGGILRLHPGSATRA